jgi:hypothetical protein
MDKPKNPNEINVERPKDVRTGPLCSICGQPEEGHPKASETSGIHDFVTEETAAAERERAKAGAPGTGVVPTEPTPPPTATPPTDKPAS